MDNGFKVQSTLEGKIQIIQKDIEEIGKIIEGIYEKMESLDGKKWRGKEKEKIDEEYMPYLKELKTKTPIYLNRYVEMIREGAELHQEAEEKIKEVGNEIEEIK